jgi:Amt family ammonium transporter
VLVNPDLGGTGVMDYVSRPGEAVAVYDMASQMLAQLKSVGLTLLWSGVVSAILFWFVDLTIGLRPSTESERRGLDITDHGERGYNY